VSPHITPRIAATAQVDEGARLESGVMVWELAHIREDAVIGEGSSLGRGAYVGPGVTLGRNCKIQNYALLYEPAVLEDGVFVGPAVVFTNDVYPRAINPDGSRKSGDDWHAVGVTVRTGAAIGARSVCIAPVEIGEWALVAAGSTVTRDVPAFALVAGSPARRIGWVGRAGARLVLDGEADSDSGELYRCPLTGERYRETDGALALVVADA
jgi:acetyltransferase-like isoleucine patch superfamily enzyme